MRDNIRRPLARLLLPMPTKNVCTEVCVCTSDRHRPNMGLKFKFISIEFFNIKVINKLK